MICWYENTTLSLYRIPDHITNAISDSDANYVAKLIFSARFLQAALNQCANFRRCCEFGNTAVEWQKVCEAFKKTSLELWKNWVDVTVQTARSQVNTLDITTPKNMIGNLAVSLLQGGLHLIKFETL